MAYFIAAILGIVQGLTEFLPVSSTAHLLLGGEMLGFDDAVFTVMIQLGSVLAVIWLYRAKILAVVVGLRSDPEARRFTAMLIVASTPGLSDTFSAHSVRPSCVVPMAVLAVVSAGYAAWIWSRTETSSAYV